MLHLKCYRDRLLETWPCRSHVCVLRLDGEGLQASTMSVSHIFLLLTLSAITWTLTVTGLADGYPGHEQPDWQICSISKLESFISSLPRPRLATRQRPWLRVDADGASVCSRRSTGFVPDLVLGTEYRCMYIYIQQSSCVTVTDT